MEVRSLGILSESALADRTDAARVCKAGRPAVVTVHNIPRNFLRAIQM